MHFAPEFLWGVGALLLLVGLVWGVAQRRTRNRANDAVTERAAHELHAHPETYDQKREELKRQVRPS